MDVLKALFLIFTVLFLFGTVNFVIAYFKSKDTLVDLVRNQLIRYNSKAAEKLKKLSDKELSRKITISFVIITVLLFAITVALFVGFVLIKA